MKEIAIGESHRAKHFAFFNALDYPHFNICGMLEAGALLDYCPANGISVFRAVLYLACKAANAIPAFRQRIRGNKVVEHEWVHPSYTSMTEQGVFSFTDVQFAPDPQQFFTNCMAGEAAVKQEASLEDDAHRDDYLFISSIPWIHFTSFQHPVHISGLDSVPRLTWGKYAKNGNRWDLPFSVQVHHALADGWHVGEYFRLLQEYFLQAESYLGSNTSEMK